MAKANHSTITRRAVLASIPSAAVATAAVAVGTAAAAPDPDAELVALIRRHYELENAACAAEREVDDAREAAEKHFPPRPPEIMAMHNGACRMSFDYELNADEIREAYDRPLTRIGMNRAEAERLKQEALAKRAEYDAAIQPILEAHGWPALRAAADALWAEHDQVIKAIWMSRSRSPVGIALKLRLAEEYEGTIEEEALDPENRLVAPKMIMSALYDAEAMATALVAGIAK